MRGTRGGIALRVASAFAALVLAQAALDAESGVRRWLVLRDELAGAGERIGALRDEVARLRLEERRLEADGFALERAIREDLGLARPGQVLLRLRRGDVSSIRIP